MLNKIKDNFKIKYLLFLLVLPILFIFKNVSAEDVLRVKTWEDVNNYFNYRVSNGDSKFTTNVVMAKSNKQFLNSSGAPLTSYEFCDKIKNGYKKVSEFHSAVFGCNVDTFGASNDEMMFQVYVSSVLTSTEYNNITTHVASESKKMIEKTTNKEELLKLVLDHVYIDMFGSGSKSDNNGYIDTTIGWSVSEKVNVIASLFFQNLGIEHKIVKGKSNYTPISYWNLININNTWFHCSVKSSSDRCFLTDADQSKYYTWDYSSYPKATTKYISSASSTDGSLTAKYTPVVALPDPVFTIEKPGVIVEQPTVPVDANDIPSTWAVVQINEAIKNGLVMESLQENYRQPITREEFAAILVAIHMNVTKTYPGLNVYQTPFKDLPGSMYSDSVEYAYHLGLVSGVANDRYAPNNLITREQIAVLFKRLIDKIGYKYTVSPNYISFADESEISSWAKESVQLLNKLEVMSGVGNNKINPKGNTTREQAMILANRVYDMMK